MLLVAQILKQNKSYTSETIRHFTSNVINSNDELYLIIGGDSFLEIKTWYKPEEIVKECYVIATTRPGFDVSLVAPYWRKKIRFVPISDIAISSTKIRNDLKMGVSIRYKVPLSVDEYIIKARV